MTITNILKKSFQLLKSNFINKQDTEETTELSIDNTPTEDSDNLVTSGGVYAMVGNVETLLTTIISGGGVE